VNLVTQERDDQAVTSAEELAQRAEELAGRADELARNAESMAASGEDIARLERELADLEEEKRQLDADFATVRAQLGSGVGAEAGGEDEFGAHGGDERWTDWRHRHHDHHRRRGPWYDWERDPSGIGGMAAAMASRMSVFSSRLGATVSEAFSTIRPRAVDTVEQTLTVDGPVSVRIDNFSGAVAVRAGAEGSVTARAERSAPRDIDLNDIGLDVRDEGAGRIAVVCSGSGAAWFARHARLTVTVPVGTPTEVSTSGGNVRVDGTGAAVQARTAGASINVSATAGEAAVETVGGSIHVADHDGPVSAKTLGGSIHLAGHLDGLVLAETQGGSVTIHGADGTVRASTNGGSVNVSGRLVGDSTLRTSGGAVTVAVPSGNQLRVDGRSTAASSDFPEVAAQRGRLDGVLGDGSDGSVSLRTVGGTVSLRRLA
jgi:hypothetical protein